MTFCNKNEILILHIDMLLKIKIILLTLLNDFVFLINQEILVLNDFVLY
jgi:hypothetical protein